MGRFLVYFLVVVGIALFMYVSKPTQTDYLAKLERRAMAMASVENNAFAELRGNHPVDEMVAAQPPAVLMQQTQIDDYVLFSIFTTEYQAPGQNPRRVRTYGLFSSLVSSKVR